MRIFPIRLLNIALVLGFSIRAYGVVVDYDSISLFKEYLHLDSLLTHQHQAEQLPPRHIIEEIERKRDQIAKDLMLNQKVSGPALAKEYEESRRRGATPMPAQILSFARRTGIAKPEFLAFAREAVGSTDLGEPRDPLLTTALEYLGEHGEESDLELMSRLDGHANQTYTQIKDRFAERLRERLAVGDGSRVKIVEDSSVQPEVQGQIEPTHLSDAGSGSESKSNPVSLFAVVVVVVLAILILLIRAFLRGRAW